MGQKRIVYSRGFPYGAPLVMLRGGATREPQVHAFLKWLGFHWNPDRHAWEHYMYGAEFKIVLKTLQGMGHEVTPKATMDSGYVISLEEGT